MAAAARVVRQAPFATMRTLSTGHAHTRPSRTGSTMPASRPLIGRSGDRVHCSRRQDIDVFVMDQQGTT
jgi:hypothetical protein